MPKGLYSCYMHSAQFVWLAFWQLKCVFNLHFYCNHISSYFFQPSIHPSISHVKYVKYCSKYVGQKKNANRTEEPPSNLIVRLFNNILFMILMPLSDNANDFRWMLFFQIPMIFKSFFFKTCKIDRSPYRVRVCQEWMICWKIEEGCCVGRIQKFDSYNLSRNLWLIRCT